MKKYGGNFGFKKERNKMKINKKFVCLFALLCTISSPIYAFNIGHINQKGYIEGYFFPKHNEYDPNQGVVFNQRYTARYGVDFYEQMRWSKINRLFAFLDAFTLFGDTLPQINYNYHAYPIVTIFKYGVGYDITNKFTIKITSSKHSALSSLYKGERLLWSGISLKYKW